MSSLSLLAGRTVGPDIKQIHFERKIWDMFLVLGSQRDRLIKRFF